MKRYHFLISVVLAVGIFFGAANYLFPRSLPEQLPARLDALLAAKLPQEAEGVYLQMLDSDPVDSSLIYAMIQNHFNIPAAARDGQTLLARLQALTEVGQTADLGLTGLGLYYCRLEQYSQALTALQQVKNSGQQYYHLAMGQVYRGLQQNPQAEEHYRQEITRKGAVPQAVASLASLYLAQGQSTQVNALLANQELAPYVNLNDRRRLALLERDVWGYIYLIYVKPYLFYRPLAVAYASLICLIWLVFFYRVSFFNRPSPFSLLLMSMAGVLATPLTFLFSDLLANAWPTLSGPGMWMELLQAVVQIGLLEELVKIIPVVLIISLLEARRRRFSPLSHLPLPVYSILLAGSLSALGFATLENAGYFSRLGLDLVYTRFWYSTVMHMAMTSLVCYAWAWPSRYGGRRSWSGLLWGLVLAALVHGLFDFFLAGQAGRFQLFGYSLMLVMVREFQRRLLNGLNHEPQFLTLTLEKLRLDQLPGLFGLVVALLGLLYFYFYIAISTGVANQQIGVSALGALPSALVVLAALGRFDLLPGRIKPFLPDFRKTIRRWLPEWPRRQSAPSLATQQPPAFPSQYTFFLEETQGVKVALADPVRACIER